jgi:type II secretory pathway pseudopilin PulG
MRNYPCRRTGISLVELLVVIAVIAVLMGLLMMGVQKVRGAADSANCINHLRQIGLAYQNYVSNKGGDRASFGGDINWVKNLMPYVENRPDVFLCPNVLVQGSGVGVSDGSQPVGYIYVDQGAYTEFGGAGGDHEIPISWGPNNDRMRLSPLYSPNPAPDGSVYLQMEDWTDWNWVDLQIKLTPTSGGYTISTTAPSGAGYTYELYDINGQDLNANYKPTSSYTPPSAFLPTTTVSSTTNYGMSTQASSMSSEDGDKILAIEYNNMLVRVYGSSATDLQAAANAFPDNWMANMVAPRHNHTCNALLVSGAVRTYDPNDIDPTTPSLNKLYWMPNYPGAFTP